MAGPHTTTWHEPAAAAGHVYFIQAEHGGPVKIGWARDPAKRIRELQTGSPHQLVIRATIPGTLTDESHLHRQFAAHRLEGEWFTPTPELELAAGCVFPVTGRPVQSQSRPYRVLLCDTCKQREATIIDLRPWAREDCEVHLLCDHPDCDTLGYWTTIERFLGNDYPTEGGMRRHIQETKSGGYQTCEAIDDRLRKTAEFTLRYGPKP